MACLKLRFHNGMTVDFFWRGHLATFQSSGHFLKLSIQHGLKKNNNKKGKGSRSIVEHKHLLLTPANSTGVPFPLRHRSLDSLTEQKYKTKSTSTTSLWCSTGTFVPEKKDCKNLPNLFSKRALH